MTGKEYQEWLQSLKVADRVAIKKTSFGIENYSITKISKITPTGSFKTADGHVFKKSGVASGDSLATSFKIIPVTNEIVDSINIRLMKRSIDFEKIVDKLSFDQLRTLLLWQEEIEKKEIK